MDNAVVPDATTPKTWNDGDEWVQVTVKNKTQYDLLLESAQITGAFARTPGSIAPFSQASFVQHDVPNANHSLSGRCHYQMFLDKDTVLKLRAVCTHSCHLVRMWLMETFDRFYPLHTAGLVGAKR